MIRAQDLSNKKFKKILVINDLGPISQLLIETIVLEGWSRHE